EQPQDRSGGADLEVRGYLQEVRISDDDVQAAVFVRVRVRLIPGIDDRAAQGGFQAHLRFDEVRALADLETGALPVLAQPDPARPAVHGAREEVRGEEAGDIVEGHLPVDEVVLVGAVRGALAVGVVLVQRDVGHAGALAQQPGGAQGYLIPGPARAHDGAWGGRLRPGMLRMGVLDVEPGAVGADGVRRPLRTRRLRGAGAGGGRAPQVGWVGRGLRVGEL